MKTIYSKRRDHALTLMEVVVVIGVLVVLAMMFLPTTHGRRTPQKIDCTNNLKQIGLAEKIWAGDNNGRFPFEVSATNFGTMELNNGRNSWINFSVMSNELSTTKILICPDDKERPSPATNFSSDLPGHVSYFVGFSSDNYPQGLLSGDYNFELNGGEGRMKNWWRVMDVLCRRGKSKFWWWKVRCSSRKSLSKSYVHCSAPSCRNWSRKLQTETCHCCHPPKFFLRGRFV